MKYLAILKDSLREALDSTVFYVMIGLSTLVILFVATLSFKPLPAEKTMAKIVDGSLGVLLDFEKNKKLTPGRINDIRVQIGVYRLKKVELLSGTADAPTSEYQLTVAHALGSPEEVAAVRKDSKEALAKIRNHFARAEELGAVRIADIRLLPADEDTAPSEIHFSVMTQPASGTARLWLTQLSLFFGGFPLNGILSHLISGGHLNEMDMPAGIQLFLLTNIVIFFGSLVSILGGVIITSFFIPNMLRKGTIDLLLVKPIHRWLLLIYKYVGGLTFILLNNAFAITGIWLVVGLRSGIWANWFLLLIPILTFFFAILYAVSTFVAVLTRSTVAAILITVGAWFTFFLVGVFDQIIEGNKRDEEQRNVPAEQRIWTNNALGKVVTGLHAILPRTGDLDQLSSLIMQSDFVTGSWEETRKLDTTKLDWGESLLVSAAFIAILLGLSCWWFSSKDY
jgi:ABC-type transport system involved in multi-copper enzyme maturation permease subunit